MVKVFIDGSAGTTGLRIRQRLEARKDVSLITLSEAQRKDDAARKEALNSADIAFLCLPDDAARQAAALTDSPDTVLIDTSTAHRTAPGWTYGFPELGGRREMIKYSKRIANPGCHASGFVSLVAPLTEKGVLSPDAKLTCFSLTGYSGGGKKMIAEYEADTRSPLLSAPRMYALGQTHKHLPEMKTIAGLGSEPVFCPIVGDFYSGMLTAVSLFAGDIGCTQSEIEDLYENYYTDGLVRFVRDADEAGFASAAALAGRDDMQISVFGCGDRITLVSRFDNLGKGASGSAIQNMNIVIGADETEGLVAG